jgi:uncharacterized sulfatase
MKRLLVWITACVSFCAAAGRPPNIVLIISDDHGWSGYGFMGNPDVRTPNLDRMASEGLLFTRGYVPASLCRPSLASIMTGLYPHQHKITGNDPPGNPRDARNRASMVTIFEQSKTIAEILAAKGYVSHQSGKWWEGECRCCGFTECMTHGDVSRGGRHGDEGLKIGRETMQPVYDFIDRAGGKPFFLWYAPFLPHTPHNPPERLLERFQAPGRPAALARYYAMIAWLDETVGQLLGYLDKKGLARDTMVLYLADNGWVQLEGKRTLYDTRAKLSPYDAGVRTPIMVRWPGTVQPRRDGETLASSVDLAPTIIRAAGLTPEASWPGLNLLDPGSLAKRNAVFGSIFAHTAVDINHPVKNLKYRWVVRGEWKLIEPYLPNAALPLWENQPATLWGRQPELYHITADPQEKTNLAGRRPDLLRSLAGELDRWWRVP